MPVSQGFKSHWDNHDVFILQFEGTKEWTIYDSPVVLPSKRRQFADGEWTRVEPTLKAVLAPGDLLYVPRGYVHEANSTDQVSGHITLGITTSTYADLALRVLEAIDADAFFRRSLPVDFRAGVDREQLCHELSRFVANADIAAVLARMDAEFAGTRMPDAADRLMDYIRLPELTPSTRLELKNTVFHEVDREEHRIVLRFNNKAVRFPRAAETSIDAILRARSFRVDDLPDDLDTESKIVVCRKLVEEGFLTIRG